MHHHSDWRILALEALIGLVAWGVWMLVSPFGWCPKCHGRGCVRCRHTGRVQRSGSRLVHQLAWGWRRDRARAADEHDRED